MWLDHRSVRLTLLAALMMALIVYGVATRADIFATHAATTKVGSSLLGNCLAQAPPPVESISRATLRELREDLRRVMFGRARRLYELGVAASSYAWSDSEPGKHTSLPPAPRDPGGYELRWWATGGDDVVADAFVFAKTDQAQDFFAQAANTRCRSSSATFTTSLPPDGRDLMWRNPDGFAQEDVYLLRGQRVYRVGVVRAGAGSDTTAVEESAAFSLVNSLACALPETGCDRSDNTRSAGLAKQLTLLGRGTNPSG